MNPSVILSGLIAPAVLIAACGSLILSTSERTSKVVNQLRAWSREFADLSNEGGPWQASRRALLNELIGLAARRAELLQQSLMALYVSIGLFVATGIAVASSALLAEWDVPWGWYAWGPVFIGLAGSASLLTGCFLLISEARLAVKQTSEEMRFAISWRARLAEETASRFDDDDEELLYTPPARKAPVSEQVLGAMPRPWRGGRRQ
jgi:hypothetical protein